MKMQVALVTTLTGIALVVGNVSADAAGGVRFGKIQYDSPGSDTGSNKNVNAEWFTLTNNGSARKNLSGWTVRDPERHIYRFPSGYYLPAGATLKVHTGNGSSTTLNRYWGEDYVWNNSGDKAILKNAAGSVVDTCRWSGIGSGSTGC